MSLVPLGSPMHVNPWTVLLMLDSRILGWQACLCRPSGISWWVCHLTISSLTHSLPVFLDFGSVSPGLLLADCGWTAMSLFLTCHWFLAVSVVPRQVVPEFWLVRCFFSILSLVGSISPCLFNVWLWTSSSGSLPLWSCLRLGWLFLVSFSSIEFDTIDSCWD